MQEGLKARDTSSKHLPAACSWPYLAHDLQLELLPEHAAHCF
jgi:hypothetical protein